MQNASDNKTSATNRASASLNARKPATASKARKTASKPATASKTASKPRKPATASKAARITASKTASKPATASKARKPATASKARKLIAIQSPAGGLLFMEQDAQAIMHKGTVKRETRTRGFVRLSSQTIWLNGKIISYPIGTSALAAFHAHKIESGNIRGNGCFDIMNVPALIWESAFPNMTREEQAARLALLNEFSFTPKHGETLRGFESVETLASVIAYLQARFQMNGGKKRGDIITSGKDAGLHEIKMRDGDGKQVDAALIEDMKQAARVSLMADLLGGVVPDEITLFRRAKNSANRCRYYATKEQAFDCIEKAIRAHDRAHVALYPGLTLQTANQPQPNCAEFLADGNNQNEILYRLHIRARRALMARYAAGANYPRKSADMLRDCRKLRALVRAIRAGDVERAAWRDNKKENENLANLAKRMREGFAIIATKPATASKAASKPATASKPAARLVALPSNRAELCAYDMTRERGNYARRIISKARATSADLSALVASFQ